MKRNKRMDGKLKKIFLAVLVIALPSCIFSKSVTTNEFKDFINKINILKVDSLEKAIQLATEFHNVASRENSSPILSKSNYSLGYVYLESDYIKSRNYFNAAMTQAVLANDSSLKADIFFQLGLLDHYQANNKSAIQNFYKALDFYISNEKQQDIANSYQNLGMIYSELSDSSKALSYYLKSLAINKKLENNLKSASVSHNIGVIYSEHGELDTALSYYKKSLFYFQKADFTEGIASVINNIGVIYEKKQNYADALISYKEALDLFIKLNNPRLVLIGYFNVGKAYGGLEEYETALEYFKQSADLAKELSLSDYLADCYSEISNLLEKKGNYKDALWYHQEFKALDDSLFNIESQARLLEIESKYSSELTEKELVLQTKKLQRKTQILYFFSFGAILFLVVTILLFIENRQKLRVRKELEEHRDHLEELIKEKTHALNVEMTERKIAEQSEKLQSAFLANMSHEIRTPMNSIIAFSNFLKDADLSNEKREEYIHYIHSCGNNLLQIIDDILDIAKLEAKQLHIEKEPCNISQLLTETYEMFKTSKLQGNNTIQFKLNKQYLHDNIEIRTDYNRLRQILTNLVDNAFKYTQEGFIEFGIQKIKSNLLFLYVSDSGTGIPLNKSKTIFERFQQTEVALDKKIGGNGLGLAICRNLIELLGGKIWVSSELKKGSTFIFTLPYFNNKNVLVNKKIKGIKRTISKTYNWDNKRILVAEDEDLNFKIIEIALRKTNVLLHRVKNGKEAVEYFMENKVDLILMDIQMPVMDGFKATQLIKSNHSDIPIIAQTSFAMNEDRKKCFEAGCNDFITKPLNIANLLKKIEIQFQNQNSVIG